MTSPKSAADTSQPDKYEEETDKPVFSSASTTAAAKPHTTASEKKPAETAKPETEKPETAKTEAYTTAQTAASSAPKEQPQTIPLIADRAEVESKVAKYQRISHRKSYRFKRTYRSRTLSQSATCY